MNDRWTETTWGEVEVGDFVKGMKSEAVFRVDRKSEDLDLAGKYGFEIFAPSIGHQSGERLPSAPCRVRTTKNGELTAAGRRQDGLSLVAENALREKLGAEMIAHGTPGAPSLAKPYIVPERFDAANLASHLYLMHNHYCGQVKPADGPGLREIHREFHGSEPRSFLGQRIPHVHDEKSFQEGK